MHGVEEMKVGGILSGALKCVPRLPLSRSPKRSHPSRSSDISLAPVTIDSYLRVVSAFFAFHRSKQHVSLLIVPALALANYYQIMNTGILPVLPSSGSEGRSPSDVPDDAKRDKKTNAGTGASAAGVRALTARVAAFYFRAPVRSFFRTRVE